MNFASMFKILHELINLTVTLQSSNIKLRGEWISDVKLSKNIVVLIYKK